MVNRQSYQVQEDLDGRPPEIDESWWEAVLAEEESRGKQLPNQVRTHSSPEDQTQTINTNEASIEVDWELALELFEQDRATRLLVTGHNRGGLLVSGEGLQGFVPISHLLEVPVEQDRVTQDEFLANYFGQELNLKIIECDQERGRVVYSERAALTEEGSRNELLNHLTAGQCIEGTVTNITNFGVFVDLGGIEGLIHISELSWGRVRHPKDVIQYGDRIRVHVINVDPDRTRIALSIKRLSPNPWESAQSRYQPGQVTEAIITSVVPFGAFARLEEGLDGLIHVSEMNRGEDRINPNQLLSEGQKVQVRVLHVDPINQRLGLGLIQS